MALEAAHTRSAWETKLSDLAPLRFKASTYPMGPAVALDWDLPDPSGAVDGMEITILRRKRRFPGRNRRGNLAVSADSNDLVDGIPVYSSTGFNFDFEEQWEEIDNDHLVISRYQYIYTGSPRDRLLMRSVRHYHPLEGGAPLRTRVRFIDRNNLVTGDIYYYTAFVGNSNLYSLQTQGSALATRNQYFDFFTMLPQIHRRLDTRFPNVNKVVAADTEKGQLQRFTDAFAVHADMLRDMVAAMGDIRNPRRADSRLLPSLAHLIGWKLKTDLDEDDQRTEIGFAHQVYQTIGTSRNIAAIVNRLTGWDAKTKAFAASVLLSFDTSRLEVLDGGIRVYLDGRMVDNPTPLPYLIANTVPVGSVDTNDADAMFKLRTHAYDDLAAYSYDCGLPDGQGGYTRNNDVWYNRETVGIFIIPDVETEFFSLEQQWERIRQILSEFLPIQTRVVFILLPGTVVEEPYDATKDITEVFEDIGVEHKSENYAGATEVVSDTIPAWNWLISNNLNHLSVDTSVMPVDTHWRSWHTGLNQAV